MKKSCLISLIALLATLLCACGSASSLPEPDAGTTPQPAITPELEIVTVPTDIPEPVTVPTRPPEAAPEEDAGACASSFSIVWISDTQHYSELYPDMLKGMMQWTADNRAAENIQLLVHTGDMINRPGSTHQWEAVTEALDTLGDLSILMVAGNHDVGTGTGNYKPFLYYIASRYTDTARLYAGGRGSFVTVGTEDCGFLFIGTGYGYTDESVEWLYDTIQAYPLYTAILCVHSYLNENGTLTDGGEILYEKIVKRCPSVRLVVCGHREGVAMLDQPLDANGDGEIDRHVYAMLYNYQEDGMDGGGGFMRILTFDLSRRSLSVRTYSPLKDTYRTDAAEAFIIENAI